MLENLSQTWQQKFSDKEMQINSMKEQLSEAQSQLSQAKDKLTQSRVGRLTLFIVSRSFVLL